MKYFLAIVLILVATTAYFIFRPEETFVVENVEVVENNKDMQIGEAMAPTPSDEDQRYLAIQQKYQRLEKSRRNLEQRLSRMKAVLWGMEFSPEQGRSITEQLQSGYALLKNRKLLGAYRSEEEIDEDLLKVEFIYQQIKETEQMVREMKESQQPPMQ